MATSEIRSSGNPFYEALNRLLEGNGFDDFVGELCGEFYAGTQGRPSVAPGVYFRTLMVGYLEGIGCRLPACRRLVVRTKWLSAMLLVTSSQAGFWSGHAAEAQETPNLGPVEATKLGTHGGWTAYVLEHGGLRVCFAETEPITWSTVEPFRAGPALQVTHRVVRESRPMMRVAGAGEDAFGLFAGSEFWAMFGAERLLSQSRIDELLENELTGAALAVRDNWGEEDPVLATYSSHGLGGAYRAIREACSEPEHCCPINRLEKRV